MANRRTSHKNLPDSKRANRAREVLLSHLRHELCTPMNAIIGYGELLLEQACLAVEEGFGSDLNRILSEARRLTQFVNALLEPSATEADGSDLERIANTMRHQLRTPLTSVIGYCEILLEGAQDQGRKDRIPDLEKMHVAGLDLLSKIDDIVNLFKVAAGKAKLDLESESAGMVLDLVPSVPPLEGSDPKRSWNTGRLLVVDDSEVSRDILSRRLRKLGHEVALAANGRQALEMIEAQEFDLILLDLIMPEMNGYQVLQRLMAREAWRGIPVIMISALKEIDSIVRCIEMGAQDNLTKPFNPVLLKARIESSLERKFLHDREVTHLKEIEKERKRADDLLHVIFHPVIVQELKETSKVQPRRYDNVAVLFSDLVGFTPYCDAQEPEDIVALLQELTEAFEEIALACKLQKVKTVGDAFMAVAGLLEPVENPVLNCVRGGFEMLAAAKRVRQGWQLRIGIHVGPVVAGVVGRRQYLYDLWGDTVNTASRIKSHGSPGAVCVSEAARCRISDVCRIESLGVPGKGKGKMEIFRVTALKPEPGASVSCKKNLTTEALGHILSSNP